MRAAQNSKVSMNAETRKVDRRMDRRVGQIHGDKRLQDTRDRTRQRQVLQLGRGGEGGINELGCGWTRHKAGVVSGWTKGKKINGEILLRRATTLWAIRGISGTRPRRSQEYKICGQTYSVGGGRPSWQDGGCIDANRRALGTMCRRDPEAVGGLSSVIECGLAAEGDRYMLSSLGRSGMGGRRCTSPRLDRWRMLVMRGGTRELARPLDRAGSLLASCAPVLLYSSQSLTAR